MKKEKALEFLPKFPELSDKLKTKVRQQLRPFVLYNHSGKARITHFAAGTAHPYHLVAESGGGSTVYGWVDADDVRAVFKPYTVRVATDALNIRSDPGTNYTIAGTVKRGEVYTIAEESDGPGASKWGKFKSGAGWIALDYVTKT